MIDQITRLQHITLGNYKYRRNHGKEKSRLVHRFGITLEKWFQLLEQQSYRCGICRRHQSTVKRPFAVDHDHKTGAVRGLLCTNCNTGLGVVENSAFVMRAEDYLKQGANI